MKWRDWVRLCLVGLYDLTPHGVGSPALLHTARRNQSSLAIRSHDNEYYINCIGR